MKLHRRHALALIGATVAAAPAHCREPQGRTDGPYVGVEVGAVDHHFVVEETTGPSQISSRNVTKWGIGGGIFAGFDTYIVPRVRIGAEASLNFGGRTPSTTSAKGQRLSITPRYGYSLTARIGYAPNDRFVAYGGGGYGAHRYRLDIPAGSATFTEWNRSFILLAGVEVRASQRANVRLEFMHLDGTRNQVMVGIPVRF